MRAKLNYSTLMVSNTIGKKKDTPLLPHHIKPTIKYGGG
jgi:hypothetical protein